MSKLDELMRTIKNDSVYVQMHNYPDQDAIASAMGLKVLLEEKGVKATICYKGEIDKYNTLKMIESLGIEIYRIDKLTMSEQDEIIIVDGQKGSVNMYEFEGKEIACIDHHRKLDEYVYEYSDIRSNVGACSSIIASYFLENEIEVDQRVATALVYGIKVDTANLSRGVSDTDIDMFCYLYKRASVTMLKQFENNSLKMQDLNSYVRAISDLRLYKDIGVADAGNDCPEAMIGTVSDFLLTLSEVDFTLVYSYRANGLKCSVRSEEKLLDACYIIKRALKGLGDGGGHATMAAGFIPNIQEEIKAKQMAMVVEERVINIIKQIRMLYTQQLAEDYSV